MATPSETITIEVHRTPPPGYSDENVGYLRATDGTAGVTLACSLALLDDRTTRDHYIANRLLLFLRMEAEGMTDEQKREAMNA